MVRLMKSRGKEKMKSIKIVKKMSTNTARVERQEQIVKLKDGRTLYKTHNGFRAFIVSKKGISTPVTDVYYNKVKANRV